MTSSCSRWRARVGDLEGIEDAHADLLDEVGQGAGDADEAHLALVAQLHRFLQRALRLELVLGEAAVELHEVEVVGLEQAQAVLDALADVLRRCARARRRRRRGRSRTWRRGSTRQRRWEMYLPMCSSLRP